MRRPALLVTTAATLACAGLGGASVPIRPHLDQVCAAIDAAPIPELALVTLDVDPAPLPDAPLVELRASGDATVDGAPATDVAQALADVGRADPGSADEPPSTSVLLAAEASVPVERVVDALRALHGAGRTWVVLVGWSDEPVPLPAPPDPALAEELRADLPADDPALRATRLAELIEREIRWCPGAIEVFSAIATVAPDQKCPLLAQGLHEALPSCPLTSADRVVTLFQVGLAPAPLRPASVGLSVDPAAAEPLRVASGTPWAEVLPAVALVETPPGWIAVGAPE